MENSLTYLKTGDYQVPNLTLSETKSKPLGRYGRMRQTYLREHRPTLWATMLQAGTLYPHLREIETTATSRLEQILPQMAAKAGVTEQMKASDPLKWTGMMNTLKVQAEEILQAELIFS